MSQEPKIAALDIAEIDRWLGDPNAPLEDLMAQFPFLATKAQARRFLEEVKVGLEDVRAGRVVSHEQIARDIAERRRQSRSRAAG